ncbi:L,D-transpeptidase [Novosphingobium sp.]|uniref:L,D-transpeptidase n=1 Tax=Novosphingobium sp. TaxID=1874826 RepID=UPI002733CB63|nr:L,D-transpeptidase [Novosphingobium sp.]MDP3905731.1 L,D-transpeptidase [Novosphingobium sp.]
MIYTGRIASGPARQWVGMVAFLLAGPLMSDAVSAATASSELPPAQIHRQADFRGEDASREARQVADWVVLQADNQGLPFIIVDKVNAKVFVFDAVGLLRGAAPVLLGMAKGDIAPADIGSRKLSAISSSERITAAGRFITSAGHNQANKDILWIDYVSSMSLHPVITTNPAERRLKRLQSPSVLDNRISFGCINVPANFYETVVRTTFTNTTGITYILPEIASIYQVFAMQEPTDRPGAAP